MAFLFPGALSGQDVKSLADELAAKNGLGGTAALEGDPFGISGLWVTSGNDSDGQVWSMLFSDGMISESYISIGKSDG